MERFFDLHGLYWAWRGRGLTDARQFNFLLTWWCWPQVQTGFDKDWKRQTVTSQAVVPAFDPYRTRFFEVGLTMFVRSEEA